MINGVAMFLGEVRCSDGVLDLDRLNYESGLLDFELETDEIYFSPFSYPTWPSI